MAACDRGRRVRYTTAPGLVNELAEAADELGYLSLDDRGAELLFQVLTEREERASVAVATNSPFGEWGRTFRDPRLAAAVVDRLTYNALIVETGPDSYRLRTSTSKKSGRRTPPTNS